MEVVPERELQEPTTDTEGVSERELQEHIIHTEVVPEKEPQETTMHTHIVPGRKPQEPTMHTEVVPRREPQEPITDTEVVPDRKRQEPTMHTELKENEPSFTIHTELKPSLTDVGNIQNENKNHTGREYLTSFPDSESLNSRLRKSKESEEADEELVTPRKRHQCDICFRSFRDENPMD